MYKILNLFLFLALIMSFISVSSQTTQNYWNYLQKAETAYQNKDYKSSLRYLNKALEIVPTNPRVMYSIARLHSLRGNIQDALRFLNKSVELGFGFDADSDRVFKSMKNLQGFREILEKIKLAKKPISNSEIAFTVGEKDLIPEGIAYDPKENSFYIGSVRKCKIVKVDNNRNVTIFAKEKQDGLRPIIGINADAKNRILLVNSAVSDYPKNPKISPEELGWSGIFKYDLQTGRLIKKYTIHKKGEKHLFNDLVFNSQGDVFITDSEYGAIYTISHEKDTLELFLKHDFIFPNGITISPDEQYLYMAHRIGIVRINISTKNFFLLHHPNNVSSYRIDGLYFYNNSLIAVQNGLDRIARFFLNHDGDRIEKLEIIEIHNPLFNLPTTGVVVKNEFYYIANSQLRSFNDDGSLFPMEKLDDVVILKAKLQN